MGVDSGAKLRAVDCRARLEDEGEDMGVKSKGEGGLHVVEKSKGLVVTSLVDVRGQALGEGKKALIVGCVGAHALLLLYSLLVESLPNHVGTGATQLWSQIRLG